jgi:hypothetical protein
MWEYFYKRWQSLPFLDVHLPGDYFQIYSVVPGVSNREHSMYISI